MTFHRDRRILKLSLIRVKNNTLTKVSTDTWRLCSGWWWWLSLATLLLTDTSEIDANEVPLRFGLPKWFSVFLKQKLLDQEFSIQEAA